MAEAAGLAFGVASLATLFSTCLQTLDVINAARASKRDQRILFTKLDNQQALLRAWGVELGLDTPDNIHAVLKQDTELARRILVTLREISTLFQNSKRLRDEYGLVPEYRPHRFAPPAATSLVPLQYNVNRARKSGRWKLPDLKGVRRTARWVITDRKAFEDLVNDLRHFIKDLEAMSRTALHQDSKSPSSSQPTNRVNTDVEGDADGNCDPLMLNESFSRAGTPVSLPEVTLDDCYSSQEVQFGVPGNLLDSFSSENYTYASAMTTQVNSMENMDPSPVVVKMQQPQPT